MKSIVIGVDPDSDRNGVAVYLNGRLRELLMLDAFQLYRYLIDNYQCEINDRDIEIHIENVKGVSNSMFHYKYGDSANVKAKKSENIGMTKQAQTTIEQMSGALGIPVVKHKISSTWKSQKEKAIFERATGWDKRSNEDTRSAAYFGFHGVK